MAKKLAFSPATAVKAGAAHRTAELPQLAKKLQVQARSTPGRKPDFPDEPVGRLNAFIPVELLFKLKKEAALSGKSLSKFIADWVESL